MMSFLKKLFQKKVSASYYDQIKTLGLHVISDEKLAARIDMYQDFHEYLRNCTAEGGTPEETLELTLQQTHDINDKLHQLAVPYGRAGSESWYAEAMRGWSQLYAMMLQALESVRNLISKISSDSHEPEAQKRELVRKVRTLFQNIYVRYALLIAEISWMREDVSTSWSAVIVQPPLVERPLTTLQMPRDLQRDLAETRRVQDWGTPEYAEEIDEEQEKGEG